MKGGFTIVFGGREFRPDDYPLTPSMLLSGAEVVRRGQPLPSGKVADYSAVEFSDVHDGTYPLDAMTEALDLLGGDPEGFQRLGSCPGIEYRNVNIFGDADTCMVDLDEEDIALLHELRMSVSIMPFDQSV